MRGAKAAFRKKGVTTKMAENGLRIFTKIYPFPGRNAFID